MLSAVTLFEKTPRAVSADGVAQDLSMKNPKLYLGVSTGEANAENMLKHLHKHIIPRMKEAGVDFEIIFKVRETPGMWMSYYTDGRSARHSTLAPKGVFGPGEAVKIWMNKHNGGENTALKAYDSMRKEKGHKPANT